MSGNKRISAGFCVRDSALAGLLSICNGGDICDDRDERRSVRWRAMRSARRQRWQLTSQRHQQQQRRRRATDRRSEHARPSVDRGLMETSRLALIVQPAVSTLLWHFGRCRHAFPRWGFNVMARIATLRWFVHWRHASLHSVSGIAIGLSFGHSPYMFPSREKDRPRPTERNAYFVNVRVRGKRSELKMEWAGLSAETTEREWSGKQHIQNAWRFSSPPPLTCSVHCDTAIYILKTVASQQLNQFPRSVAVARPCGRLAGTITNRHAGLRTDPMRSRWRNVITTLLPCAYYRSKVIRVWPHSCHFHEIF